MRKAGNCWSVGNRSVDRSSVRRGGRQCADHDAPPTIWEVSRRRDGSIVRLAQQSRERRKYVWHRVSDTSLRQVTVTGVFYYIGRECGSSQLGGNPGSQLHVARRVRSTVSALDPWLMGNPVRPIPGGAGEGRSAVRKSPYPGSFTTTYEGERLMPAEVFDAVLRSMHLRGGCRPK